MNRLLYQIHRWGGIALALFMLTWFSSGLVIMYASPSALPLAEQLAYKDDLNPETGWLSLGQAWQAGAESRQALARSTPREGQGTPKAGPDWIAQARLLRLAERPYWLVETGQGQRLALSAIDGQAHQFTRQEAQSIARNWLKQQALAHGEPPELQALRFVDTGPQDSSVRNLDALRPFHRVALADSSRELLISARTGEVVRDTLGWERGLYWAGNWIHLLRPLDSIGLKDQRQTVLAWLGGTAALASLTGLIIGWQRWRPGWGGRPTYSQGRKHPYRDVWNTWHFWTGLIGGTAALLWATSGYLSTNPFQVFTPAAPSKLELARYQGRDTPPAMLEWRTDDLAPADILSPGVVELAWRHLGTASTLVATTRDGQRRIVPLHDNTPEVDANAITQAAARLAGKATVAHAEVLTDYDSYYYPRHHQSALDRPLPVTRIMLDDEAGTHLYVDPRDGQLLLKQDASRRAYRWLYSALHHWDFGWLYQRPLWDGWMLPLVWMGIVLGGTAVVLGCKRLQMEHRSWQKKRAKRLAQHPTPTSGRPEHAGQRTAPLNAPDLPAAATD